MSLVIMPEVIPISTDEDGVMRIAGTRVTLDTIIAAYFQGESPEEIALQYPALNVADVHLVFGYYLHHRDKVDAYLKEREKKSAQVRAENERRFNPVGIRERLLARQK